MVERRYSQFSHLLTFPFFYLCHTWVVDDTRVEMKEGTIPESSIVISLVILNRGQREKDGRSRTRRVLLLAHCVTDQEWRVRVGFSVEKTGENGGVAVTY